MTATTQEPFSLKEDEICLLLSDRSELGDLIRSLGLGKVMKRESGEPYLTDSAYYVSLTHKGETGVVALSHKKVGVDIEKVTVPRNVKRLSRLFNEEEAPSSLYDFYKIWTGKEAIGKLLGTGITYDVLKKKTEGVRHFDFGEYLIAVAGEGEITIREYR